MPKQFSNKTIGYVKAILGDYLEQYYIIGGQQKNQIFKDWELYQKGLIVKVIPKINSVKQSAVYISPPEVCPDVNPSCSFTAGKIKNNYLYVGTHTEVLKFSLPDFKIEKIISLPFFNDIHHVRPTDDGNILVVNTGLDMVIKISEDENVKEIWNVRGYDPWAKFSRNKDYRKVSTTKPHESHPNYVFTIGKELWATRCLQKDAICLTNKGRIDIGRQLVHDGVVFGNFVYFTQVDGCIVAADIHDLKVKHIFNLKDMTKSEKPLGWCRGLKILNNDTVIVGFTRIRPSKTRNPDGTVSKEGQYGVLPTRIACYDLAKENLLWEQNLEAYGMNAIYSIQNVK